MFTNIAKYLVCKTVFNRISVGGIFGTSNPVGIDVILVLVVLVPVILVAAYSSLLGLVLSWIWKFVRYVIPGLSAASRSNKRDGWGLLSG